MISIPFLPGKTDSAAVIALAAVTGSVAILSAAVAAVVAQVGLAALADQVVLAVLAAADVALAAALVAACPPRLSARARAS